MTLKEIDDEIYRLKQLRKVECDKEISELKEAAKKNVGRCFKVNGVYAKVVGIPTEEYSMTGTDFNPYQYPALFLYDYCYEEFPYDMPFAFDALFSAAWGDGRDAADRKYEEITKEEFNEEFKKRIQEFREKVTGV